MGKKKNKKNQRKKVIDQSKVKKVVNPDNAPVFGSWSYWYILLILFNFAFVLFAFLFFNHYNSF